MCVSVCLEVGFVRRTLEVGFVRRALEVGDISGTINMNRISVTELLLKNDKHGTKLSKLRAFTSY